MTVTRRSVRSAGASNRALAVRQSPSRLRSLLASSHQLDSAAQTSVAEPLSRFNTIPAPCVLYRRTCHERFCYWPEEIAESGDWALWKSYIASGGANLAYEPAPTALHFRANWRSGNVWAPPPLPEWLAIASRGQSPAD